MFFITILISITLGALAAPKDPLSNFFIDKTKLDKPFELRDPFKEPQLKTEKNQVKAGYFISGKGQYSNIKTETIADISTIKVVGVLIGRERRAMVRSMENGPISILKEGMKLGESGAELKAILPGGIVLVEKIVNVYGQDEYLETVIPISK